MRDKGVIYITNIQKTIETCRSVFYSLYGWCETCLVSRKQMFKNGDLKKKKKKQRPF